MSGIRDLAASHDGYDKQQRADLLIAKGCCDAAGRLLHVNGLQASAILPPQSIEEGAIGLRRAEIPINRPFKSVNSIAPDRVVARMTTGSLWSLATALAESPTLMSVLVIAS